MTTRREVADAMIPGTGLRSELLAYIRAHRPPGFLDEPVTPAEVVVDLLRCPDCGAWALPGAPPVPERCEHQTMRGVA